MKSHLKKCHLKNNDKEIERDVMIKRILSLIIKVFGIVFLTSFIPFFLLTYLSKDPAETSLRVQAITPTQENIIQRRHELGLDTPFFIRYLKWIGNAIQGDFGLSYVSGKNIKSMILDAFPYTFILMIMTVVFILITCFIFSMLMVHLYNHWFEKIMRVLSFILSAVPSFWLGILLISLFSVKYNVFPTGGFDGFYSVILPAITLSIVYSSSYIRLIRNEFIQNRTQQYVNYYKVRGFSQKKIGRHILKNSLKSSLVSIGVSIPKLIAGSIIVESVFAWPGLGLLCINAIHNRDIPVLQAYIVLTALFFVFSGMIVEKLMTYIDPRLSERGSV